MLRKQGTLPARQLCDRADHPAGPVHRRARRGTCATATVSMSANLDAELMVFLEKSDFIRSPPAAWTRTPSRSVRRVDGVADAGPDRHLQH
ncbi:MAG: hypothetical protein M0C28_29625 [Candidatus Moduliflexus flocculans]|nr:hypothetical protein [Candidatus Moduliflexus flocculans]